MVYLIALKDKGHNFFSDGIKLTSWASDVVNLVCPRHYTRFLSIVLDKAYKHHVSKVLQLAAYL